MKHTTAALLFLLSCLAPFESRALDRPRWMDEPGIVMAGNWEEPTFRARRAGRMDFTLAPEKLAPYQREHSPQIIARLKDLGVNFLMIHGYKGAGMATEAAGMEDSRRFAALAHKAGMRVGTYIGGTMLYERLFLEEPLAPRWQAFGSDGSPIFYADSQRFRYASVRNHPGFIEYLQEPTRYAIRIIGTDLVHFDNFGLGAASYDSFSKAQFRAFLEGGGQFEPLSIGLDDAIFAQFLGNNDLGIVVGSFDDTAGHHGLFAVPASLISNIPLAAMKLVLP